MNRTIAIVTVVACLLTFLPATAADPLRDPIGHAGRCTPPSIITLHWEVVVELCPAMGGVCSYEVFPGTMEPNAGSTWGASLDVAMQPAAGSSTFVRCNAVASLRSLHYGTEGIEVRWADMRLGHLVGGPYVPDPPAAREAVQPYGPGQAAVLELELEVDVWQVFPNAVPAADSAAVSVPMAYHNTAWTPNLSLLGGPWGYSLEEPMSRELPLHGHAAQQGV